MKSTRFIEGDCIIKTAVRSSSHKKKKKSVAQAVFKGQQGNLHRPNTCFANAPAPKTLQVNFTTGQLCIASSRKSGLPRVCKIQSIIWQVVNGINRPLYTVKSELDGEVWSTAFIRPANYGG